MKIKCGKGRESNSSAWYVHHSEVTNAYTAKLALGTSMGEWISLYLISEEIYEKAGTFGFEDKYDTENLIRTGTLLYKYSNEKMTGEEIKILSPDYRVLCGWALQ